MAKKAALFLARAPRYGRGRGEMMITHSSLYHSTGRAVIRHALKAAVVCVAVVLTGCMEELYGPLDNPVDPNGDDYQGFDTVAEADEIEAQSWSEDTTSGTLRLVGTAVVAATGYHIQVATDDSFDSAALIYEDEALGSDGNTTEIDAGTVPFGTHYWRIRAEVDGSWGIWSAPLEITRPVRTYTVSFNSNGGTAVPPQTIEERSTVTEPTAPTKSGFIFGGWFTDDDTFSTSWDFANDTVIGDLTLHASWLPIPKILAADGASDDLFGYSVAISGDYAIVGARLDDDNGSDSGSAYIFRRTGTNSWDGGTKILPSDGASDDQFGFSVAISGDYAIVGAQGDDDNSSESGSAYIFRRTGTNSWDGGTKILPSDGDFRELFGHSVAISGDYAIVGALNDDDNGSDSGSAYIFRRTGTTSWDGGTEILPSDGASDDEFGNSVAISGDYAIVGARLDDDNGSASGSAYIFRRTGTNSWDGGTKILPSDGASFDRFGYSVAISGGYAIVGARFDEDNGGLSGSAYMFRRTGTNSWDGGTKILPSDGASDDFFGDSVAISGDYAIVAASGDDDNGSNSGSAYITRVAP